MREKGIMVIALSILITTVFLTLAQDRGTLTPRTSQARDSVREQGTRAYAGAPPTVPHDVEPMAKDEDCLDCHTPGNEVRPSDLKDIEDPIIPHPQVIACQQCHIPESNGKVVYGTNRFRGALYPEHGKRAHPVAPPLIPHRLQNREYCLACHGPHGNPQAPRSTHIERLACLQCHVPAQEFAHLP